MVPSSNDDVQVDSNMPARYNHTISHSDFMQDSEVQDDFDTKNTITQRLNSTRARQFDRQSAKRTDPVFKLVNSSSGFASSLLENNLQKSLANESPILDPMTTTFDDDGNQTQAESIASIPPLRIFNKTDRAQQTTPLKAVRKRKHHRTVKKVENKSADKSENGVSTQDSTFEQKEISNDLVNIKSEEQSLTPVNDKKEESFGETKTRQIVIKEDRPLAKAQHGSLISPPATSTTKTGKSSPLKNSSSFNLPRYPPPILSSIPRLPIQGVLVQFFRNGDEYHPGIKLAINQFELKSWEAFLNYINCKPGLALSTGGIKHIYTLTGQEIRAIRQLQNRQSYVVSSGIFIPTDYHYFDSSFADELNPNVESDIRGKPSRRWNGRRSKDMKHRSPQVSLSSSSSQAVIPANSEQIFILPYSRLDAHESIILNRNLTITFDDWLQDQVTDLLSKYTNHEKITNLFGVTQTNFKEVESFSLLFNILSMTDTFIACTDDEYVHAKHYLATMKPDDLFTDRLLPEQGMFANLRRSPSKRSTESISLSLSWVYGYCGDNELTKTIHALPENEILYTIGSICIIYEPNLRQQRYYTQHNNQITCVNVHQHQVLVASSETVQSKNNQRTLIHIWDHVKLQTIAEIRKEQFGSQISLLLFSPKRDDNLILVISRDKPKIVLFLDWKRNDLIYSITCKSDDVLSTSFVFDTTEWITCITQRHLIFYNVNWNSRPLHMIGKRESEVQNVYTGAAACDPSGERFLVGDKVGSVHMWRLVNNEPKLIDVRERILENEIEIIISINEEEFLFANQYNQIKIWNIISDTFKEIRLNENIGPVQSICGFRQDSTINSLTIGTKLNTIVSKDMNKNDIDIIMRGHTSPSVCVCCDPESQYFFSVSSDRYLFKWNSHTKNVEWSTKSTQAISCADLHPERNIIVLGTETSKLLIYDTLSSYYIATISLKVNTGVKSVRFSPDGSDLAVGLQNGNVCIFSVLGNGDFQLRTDEMLQSETGPVSSVVWSTDSKYLLAIYADNDYNIWSMPPFEIAKGKNIQNIRWNQFVHPIMCKTLDKPTMDTHNSAIIFTPNLVLCCGKDGQLRAFRHRNNKFTQTFQFGLGSIQNLIPSTSENFFLSAIGDNPVIIEINSNISCHSS